MRERNYWTAMKAYGEGYNFLDSYILLRNGIVLRAVDDYISVLIKLLKLSPDYFIGELLQERLKEKEEIEAFFLSDWFSCLTDIVPWAIINYCRDEALRETKIWLQKRVEEKINETIKGF